MKKIIAIAAIIAAAFTFAACGNLVPEKEPEDKTVFVGKTNVSNVSGETPIPDVDNQTPETPVTPPDDEDFHDPAISLVMTPGDGWTISPGEILSFKVFLLVNNEYTDITDNDKTVFDTNNGLGKCINGDSFHNLKNGQEIVVKATYDTKYPVHSVGKYVLPAECADNDDEVNGT